MQDLIEKLPHCGAMRLLDEVLRAERDHAVTLTRFGEPRRWLLDEEGRVPAYVCVELVAQSAALCLIRPGEATVPMQGVIAQVKHFRASDLRVEGESELKTDCRVEVHLDGTLVAVSGTVSFDGAEWCAVELTLSIHG